MNQVMVVLAEKSQIGEVGQATVLPLTQVVADDEEHGLTAGEDAVTIPRRQTTRRWASVANRSARPSYMVWPSASSSATISSASQASRRATSAR